MTLHRRHFLMSAGAVLLPAAVHAQSKPTIRIVVGFPAGGATDAIARVVADRLPGLLGQPVIIENKPGAGGRLAADLVLAAPADGLTFMVAPNATPTRSAPPLASALNCASTCPSSRLGSPVRVSAGPAVNLARTLRAVCVCQTPVASSQRPTAATVKLSYNALLGATRTSSKST